MNKILYFEGAGLDYTNKNSDIGNYRIRTAFKNDKGKKIYLEMGSTNQYDKKGKLINQWGTRIDHLFEITEVYDDNDNKHTIKHDYEQLRYTPYNKNNIIKWINKYLDCSFDDLQVLHWLEGYRVHGDNRTFNLMDDHVINTKRTLAREAAYNICDKEYKAICDSHYSVISLLDMDDDSITIKCHASDTALKGVNRIKKIIVKY